MPRPYDQIEMMMSYTASRWQVFHMVRMMQALPYIFVGLDVAIVLSVIGAIVGEFVGAKAGLGYLLLQKNFNFDMAGTFAVLVVLSLIGVGPAFAGPPGAAPHDLLDGRVRHGFHLRVTALTLNLSRFAGEVDGAKHRG